MLTSNENKHQEGAVRAMNFQTLIPPPVTTHWLLGVRGFQQVVVEMKDYPNFRIDHATHTVWVSFCFSFLISLYLPFFFFSFSHSIVTDFQSNALF